MGFRQGTLCVDCGLDSCGFGFEGCGQVGGFLVLIEGFGEDGYRREGLLWWGVHCCLNCVLGFAIKSLSDCELRLHSV